MKKSRGIITLLVALLLFLGLGYVAMFGADSKKTGSAANIKQGLDLAGGVSITYEVLGDEKPSETDMKDTIYKLQKRVEDYSTEAQVYQEGENRINIEIPGVTDADAILQDLGKPGTLYFILQTNEAGVSNYQYDFAVGNYVLARDLDEIIADGSAVLTGTDVKSAEAGTRKDNTLGNNESVVQLNFTEEGTVKFAQATKTAFNKGQSIGIYYDDEFKSVPKVNTIITGGTAEISGMADFDEAEKLASVIRIGGLKLELEELRSNVVGAQLGEEAIATSVKAGAIGLVIVALFMIAVYWLPGLASAIALFLYIIFTLLALNAFNITLTLPGIAGIILSIGMAVDANVIIFARIREELATGKTVQSSIKIGFQKALSAIVDGNITTLIAAMVLAVKGSGSVKGFAQTLALGIIISMFTALFVTRMILNAMFAIGLKSEKLYGVAKEKKTINFIGKKNIFFAISITLILAGFVFMGINNKTQGNILNYNLEFQGGTSTTITFNDDLSLADIATDVKPVIAEITGDTNIQAQKVKDSTEVIIKTRTLNVEERIALSDALTLKFGITKDIQQESISATVSSEMRRDAVVAVIVATFFMLIYIWFRFKDIRFAASAVIALMHDVLIVLAFYVIARVSVGNTFIACMLTIVGYSINATIVIFDRIRENLKEMKKNADLVEVVNKSITQTLTRSIYTSLTTFIMVAVLFVMGVPSIKEFAGPLMVGIVGGGYSSVCITGSLWYVFKTKLIKKK
ncbi:MAG TPA: protein translocase subunit SecD [Lachnospiraceae bacterium]|nr:protein translocase subunit SecD [Lachnospiraceae bacterium]